MEEDHEVSFEGRVNVATGARKATSVQLGSKATEQSSKRELGQVSFAYSSCSCLSYIVHKMCQYCKSVLCPALLCSVLLSQHLPFRVWQSACM